MGISLQEQYGPDGTCFGCGPKNEKGLQIKSHFKEGEYILRYTPQSHHQAFPGAINGGIIGALFDCHMNWAAAHSLFINDGGVFPSTVTSEFHVKLKRPTPYGTELLIKAKPVEVDGNKVTVEAEMYAGDKITTTCRGTFVSVPEGHPAYHRWQ